MTLQKSYVPHIDGLRTVAVLSVFLFHLDLPYVDGGYLGVDVFFVISGFLITKILKDATENGTLSFWSFYARRIRRLFPALFVLMLLCTAVGYALLSPERFQTSAVSGIYALLSVSNFYFFFNSGYFDADAETQLYLHTWSLAVEEQFYLVWPLLIFLVVGRFARNRQVAIIVGLLVFGTVLSYVGTRHDPSLAFYMMPFRTAEFCLGALLCWQPPARLRPWIVELVVAGSMLTLCISFVTLAGNERFPGWIVLIPCLASAVLIHLGSHSTLARWILGNDLSTYIGRISYSLYLYHWPAILFYQIYKLDALNGLDRLAIIAIAFSMAIASYNFVEKPLRNLPAFWPDNRQVGIKFSAGVLLLTVVLGVIVHMEGLPGRVPTEIRDVLVQVKDEKARRFEIAKNLCRERGWDRCYEFADNQLNVVILGDSHGPDALNILQPVWPEAHYLLLSVNGCPPMTPEVFERKVTKEAVNYEECRNRVYGFAEPRFFSRADIVVVSARYNWYTPADLQGFLHQIALNSSTKLLIFEQAPSFARDLPDLVFNFGRPVALEEYVSRFVKDDTWSSKAALRNVAETANAVFLPKASFYCEEKGVCDLFFGPDRKLLTYDEHHLGTDAALSLGKYIKVEFPDLM